MNVLERIRKTLSEHDERPRTFGEAVFPAIRASQEENQVRFVFEFDSPAIELEELRDLTAAELEEAYRNREESGLSDAQTFALNALIGEDSICQPEEGTDDEEWGQVVSDYIEPVREATVAWSTLDPQTVEEEWL